MKASWKTTLAGVLAIATAIVGHFWPQHLPLLVSIGTALTGLGLMAARDNGVTSEDVRIRKSAARLRRLP